MLQYWKLVAIVFKWEFRNLQKDFEPYIEAVKKNNDNSKNIQNNKNI